MPVPLLQGFTTGQVAGLVGFGSFYWAVAALVIRHRPKTLFGSGTNQLITYGSLVPISYAGIRAMEVALSLSPRHRLITASVSSATALLLDGIAMLWFPEQVYENPEIRKVNPASAVLHARMGASAILFGVGVILTIAITTNAAV